MKYFLGEAANYGVGETFEQLFTHGNSRDSAQLRTYLAAHYASSENRVSLHSTGRAALAAGIKALVPKNSQVIVNGFTCQAVVEAVRAASCTPIYADINPDTLHFDDKILARVLAKHPSAKAIIVQNTLGIPASPRLFSYARRHNLVVIEDLAHSAGRAYADGTECGLLGAATVLSFGKGKAIDTISGGALILRGDGKIKTPVRAPHLADSLRARFYPVFGAIVRALFPSPLYKIFLGSLLKIHFIERSADAKLEPDRRLSHWQAKLALQRLQALEKTNLGPLRDFRLVEDREAVLKKLAEKGYYFDEIWYDCPISPKRNYAKWNFDESECPVATEVSKHIVNIPTIYGKTAMKEAYKIIERGQK